MEKEYKNIMSVVAGIAIVGFIIIGLLFTIQIDYTKFLEKQLQERDSINTINMSNHLTDSVVISEIPEYMPKNYFEN